MNSKKGFIFQYGTAAQMERLMAISGPEAVIRLLQVLEAYSMDGEEPEDLDPVAGIIFEGMRRELDRDREKYEARVEQNRQNNEKRKKHTPQEPNGAQWGPMAPDNRQKTEDSRQEIENKDSMEGAEALIDIPLAKGKTLHVTQEIFDMLADCYPAVNTMEQLRKMKAWSISNPKRRKVDGMKFLNNWFSFEQDKHHEVARSGTTKTMTAEEIWNLPAVNPWRTAT